MEWLNFEQVCFDSHSSIGQLCEDLNEIVGLGIYYDTFEIQNNTISAINNGKAICGYFGLYPSSVAGILNSTKQIHFCVLCNEKLIYEYYINKCIDNRECKFTYKCDSGYFYTLSSQSHYIFIMFKERVFHKQQPSELIFAQSVLKKIQLSCLTDGIVTVNGRVTFITNEVKSSMHDCTYSMYFCDSDSPIKLANCKVYSHYCSLHPNNNCPYHILFHSLRSRRTSPYMKCLCHLCVKNKTHSLKSLCVNKLQEITQN